MRTPDEILDDFDAIAELIADHDEWNLRALLWEVIEDMLDSLQGYATWDFATDAPDDIVSECRNMLADYVTNNYGDT